MNFEDHVLFHVTMRSHYCEKDVIIIVSLLLHISKIMSSLLFPDKVGNSTF